MKNSGNKFLLSIVIVISWAVFSVAQAYNSKVILSGCGSENFRETLGNKLTAVVSSLDGEKWADVQNCFTAGGFDSFKELAENTHCLNVNPVYELKLLKLADESYEVRDVKVLIEMGTTPGNPYQNMVFSIDTSGDITDVRFALEQHQYQEIVKQGEILKDFACRQKVTQFLEIFRTAYNRKDSVYLEKVFSNDALIIVGRMLKEKPDCPDLLDNSTLTKKQIQFVKLSKREYLDRLDIVFHNNEVIKVNFDEIKLINHPSKEKIYGVTLKQNWHTSNYSDEGYLFLMIDYRDENNPLIHVRAWQPEKFPDGSVISLGNFELIE